MFSKSTKTVICFLLKHFSVDKLPKKLPIPEVDKILLVSSAKGGVGKSTVACNLALSLLKVTPHGRVGLLDADVFGPSIPKMFNLEAPHISAAHSTTHPNLLEPIAQYGLKLMSMGFLSNRRDGAFAWRGLMVMQAVQQLLRNVAWGPLDALVVDLPPGTGDVPLSLVQNVPIASALLVTTPQHVAVADVERGLSLWRQMRVPVCGLVLNMAHHVCSHCGQLDPVFRGLDGVTALLNKQHTDAAAIRQLISLPLDSAVCESGDRGMPIVLSQSDLELSKSFGTLAEIVWSAANA